MSRISPADLPQPVYPSGRAPVPAGIAAPVAPPPSPANRTRPRVPKAAIWGGAGVAAAIAAVVLGLVLTGGKPANGPGPQPGPQTGPAHTAADTSNAVDKLVGGVQLTNGEHSCLYNDLDKRPELVAAVNAGGFDTTEAADVIAGCVSPQTVADLLDVAFQSAGVDAVISACIRSELGGMSESSLASTVKALLDGDSNQLAEVLSSEAAYCFRSS